MSDSNMNAKTEAAENKSVPVDESQRPIMPEENRLAPEEDKRRIRALRGGKCVPDVLRRIIGEATKDHPDTPSEKLVKAAKERDILFDMINHWQDELDEAVGRECATGKNDDADFIREYIAALSAAKDVLTRRITALLAQT